MKHSLAPLIAALGAAFGTAPLAHAEILIGASGPMTGTLAWFGEQMQQGMDMKVAELNATGGVLGQQVELLMVYDYCDPQQAVAAAEKLVEARVAAVIGHFCSGASIPASKVYAEAGVLMISPYSTNPALTEQGFANVFRVGGRDTLQATMVADYLAERWGDQDIAIVHDGQAYGKGIAEEARRRLGEHGVTGILFEAIVPGQTDYSMLIDKLQVEGIDALYFGGYTAEAGHRFRRDGRCIRLRAVRLVRLAAGQLRAGRPGQAGRLRFESARRGLGQEQIGEQQERAVAMLVTETYQRRC